MSESQSPSFQETRATPELPKQKNDPENSDNTIKSQLMDTIFHGQANDFLRNTIHSEKEKLYKNLRIPEEIAKENIEMLTEAELQDFQNLRSMSALRQRATHLFDQYNNDPMKDQSTKQAWYTRQAHQIWESAGLLVDRYLKYKDGGVRVESFAAPTTQILEDMQKKVPEAYAISKEIEKNYGSKKPEVTLIFPVKQKGKERNWDSDSITLEFDENGDIQKVHFDENYNYMRARKLEDLAASQKAGKKLSLSQQDLLAENNLLDTSIEGDKNTEAIMKIPPQDGKIRLEPLFLLGYVLPKDLKEKTKGLWGEAGNFSQGFDDSWELQAGEIVISTHEHDHSPIEEAHATLDAKQLTKEDIYRIVGTYIDVLRAFPRTEGIRS